MILNSNLYLSERIFLILTREKVQQHQWLTQSHTAVMKESKGFKYGDKTRSERKVFVPWWFTNNKHKSTHSTGVHSKAIWLTSSDTGPYINIFFYWCLTMAQFLLKFSSRELRFFCHDVERNFTTIIYFVLTPILYTSAEYSWSVKHQLIFHWDCRYFLIIFFIYKHVILRSFDDQALQRYYKLKSAKANYGNIKYIKTLWTI